MEELKDLCKLYTRVDGDEEDSIFELLIENARMYIDDAVDNMDWDNEKAYTKAKLMIVVLVSDWYENREYVNEGKISNDVRYTINSLKLQLDAILIGGSL